MEVLFVIVATIILFTFLTRVIVKYLNNEYSNPQFGTNLGDKHWEKLNRSDDNQG